jgi:hypothetical protein
MTPSAAFALLVALKPNTNHIMAEETNAVAHRAMDYPHTNGVTSETNDAGMISAVEAYRECLAEADSRAAEAARLPANPPHSPARVPVLSVSAAAGAKANSCSSFSESARTLSASATSATLRDGHSAAEFC